MLKIPFWTALCLPLILSACADDGSCRVTTIGDLTVLNNTGFPIVRAVLNEHPVAFIVDTGAARSTLWPKEVDKLGLDSVFGMVPMKGTGGETTAGIAVADTLGLGHATASHVTFVTAGNLFDGRTVAGLPVVGLFGAEFLSAYDVFFDLPDHKINLYQVHGCTTELAAWSGTYEKLKVDHDYRDSTKIVIKLRLNDKPVDAFLDSGAHGTLISQDDAADAGVRKADLKTDHKGIGYGIDDEKMDRFLHRFRSLDIGQLHIENPKLIVGDTEHTLLGADFFRHRRIWIPRYDNAIFVKRVPKNESADPNAAPFPTMETGVPEKAG